MNNFRKQGAHIHNFEAKVLNPAITTQLDCGIPVYLIKNNSIDISQIDFIFDAGIQYQQKKLVPQHCLPMMREGSKKHNAADIASILEHHAVYTESLMNRKTAGMGFYIQRKFISEVLPVITNFMFSPSFPQQELDIFNKNMHQRMKIENEKVKVMAAKRIATKIYGEKHPMGMVIEPDDVFSLSAGDLIQYHNERYHHGICRLVISGYYDDALLTELNNAIKPYVSSNSIDDQFSIAEPESEAGTKFEYLQKQGATQAAIRMGKLIDMETKSDYHLLKVLNTLLGGYFGSRLMKNIREDKGYTYGIGSAVQWFGGKALFNIMAEVNSDVWKDAVEEINKEIYNLHNGTIPFDELNMVKKTMLGDILGMFDGAYASARVLKSLMEAEQDYSFLEATIEAIHNADEYSLQQLAKKYLKPEDLYVVVAGA